MNISDPAMASRDTTMTRLNSLAIKSATRTALLFAVSGAIGGVGWSGQPSLHCLAFLFPFVYLQSRRRLDSLSALFYYSAATWVVVPGSEVFFHSDRNPMLPVLIWVALTVLGAAPWILFYNRRWLPVSAIAAIVVLALPPISLVTVAHPLIAAGQWFPGTRWLGLCLPLVLIAAHRLLGQFPMIAILIAASLVTHARFARPGPDPYIVAVNTQFDMTSEQGSSGSTLEVQEASLQRIALAHPRALVILPESIISGWSPMHEARWAATFELLKKQHTGLLIGTTIPIPNSEANRNILLSRGFTERLSYVQRVPVPLGMWQLGSEANGFPLMLRFPSTVRVWNRRAGVLICYEQLLVWPALQTLAHNPELLIAPSNIYWASRTSIPAIQHIAAQDWADLWSIPLYEASNR